MKNQALLAFLIFFTKVQAFIIVWATSYAAARKAVR